MPQNGCQRRACLRLRCKGRPHLRGGKSNGPSSKNTDARWQGSRCKATSLAMQSFLILFECHGTERGVPSRLEGRRKHYVYHLLLTAALTGAASEILTNVLARPFAGDHSGWQID